MPPGVVHKQIAADAARGEVRAEKVDRIEIADPSVPSIVPVGGSVGDRRMGALSALIAAAGGCAVIDGGLATELERRGADLNDPLWSAKCLVEDDAADMIRQVHLDYYRAGADICTSASYQATIQGFTARGFRVSEAEALLRRSVQLVVEARDEFWREYETGRGEKQAEQGGKQGSQGVEQGSVGHSSPPRLRPLVAASIGSYGAFLADGSEYSGDYGPAMTVDKLMNFHRRRLQVLSSSGADLIAFETIPCKVEAEAIVRLLNESPSSPLPAWISFNSKDGADVVRGDDFQECVLAVSECARVEAVGINCTPPRFILGLLQATRKVTSLPIVVYPNSGEAWDGVTKKWVQSSGVTDDDFVSFAPEWIKAGANVLGGCCRTTPHTIQCIADVVHQHQHNQQQHHQQQPAANAETIIL